MPFNPRTMLTVVIPVFNRAETVKRTLESLERQSWQGFNVILIDNNSTDGTLNTLTDWQRKYPNRTVVLSEKRPGACAARQCGLDAVETDWTLFFDSDDMMLPNHLERIRDQILSTPDAMLIGWDVYISESDNKKSIHSFPTRDMQYNSLFHGGMATQRYCARTSLFREAGGWNPEIRVWNDIELGARLLSLNPKVVKIKGKPSVCVYPQPDSITHSISRENIDITDASLISIAATLGERRNSWVRLKQAILAASLPGPHGKILLGKALDNIAGSRQRLIIRLAYGWTRFLPGAARLLRPFF